MNENEEKSVNSEEIKKETENTVNDVKDTIKNVNIKSDAKDTKGFLYDLWKNPLGKIQEIATDGTNKYFKYALILLIVWAILLGVDNLLSISFTRLWNSPLKTIWAFVVDLASPILVVLTWSCIFYLMNKDHKKSLTTILTTVVTAKIPVIVSTVVSYLTLISSSAYKLTSPFSGFCSIISTILLYFSAKSLFEEDKNSIFFKKYVAMVGIYYIIKFLISFLGIIL